MENRMHAHTHTAHCSARPHDSSFPLQVCSWHRSEESTISASRLTVPPTSLRVQFYTKMMMRSSWSPTSRPPVRAATRRPTALPCCWRRGTGWRWCCGTTRRSGTTATTTAPSAASCCSPCEDPHDTFSTSTDSSAASTRLRPLSCLRAFFICYFNKVCQFPWQRFKTPCF